MNSLCCMGDYYHKSLYLASILFICDKPDWKMRNILGFE